MRPSPLLSIGLVAAVLVTTGCGRVSATQTALPAGGATSAKKAAGGASGGSTLGGKAPTVQMMAAGVGAARGRVLDAATKRPVAGATIVIQPGGQRVTTDANGNFQAPGLTGGNYTFQAQASGLAQVAPTGTLIMPNEMADVPEILMAPGNGPSGVTSVTYVLDKEMGRLGEAPATLVNPVGVAARGADVLVLDTNGSAFVKTGIVRQYDAETGGFDGKFGDYSKWLGLSQMKNTVRAIAVDAQGRSIVLDAGKVWRFAPDGDKEKAVDLAGDGVDIAADAKGGFLVAGPEGVTRLNGEAEGAQPFGTDLGECRAVAPAKDGGIWVVRGAKVAKVGEDGNVMMEFGAGGPDGGAAFNDPVDVATDPRNGHVVVVDKGAKQVYVYDPMGTLIGKVGQGTFETPIAATVDAGGRVYVLDGAKRKVYKFLPGVSR